MGWGDSFRKPRGCGISGADGNRVSRDTIHPQSVRRARGASSQQELVCEVAERDPFGNRTTSAGSDPPSGYAGQMRNDLHADPNPDESRWTGGVLIRETNNREDSIRMFSGEALGSIGYSTERSVARLKALLQDPAGKVRFAALRSLFRLEEFDDAGLIPQLEKLALEKDGLRGEQVFVLYGLWKLNAPESEKNLTDYLATADPRYIWGPFALSTNHGEGVEIFAPVLAQRLSETTNAFVRAQLAKALRTLGDPGAESY